MLLKQLKEFVTYVNGFYGKGGIYEMKNCKKSDIQKACEQYMYNLMTRKTNVAEWGDGDSVDRERVRELLENEYGFSEVNPPK
jgi:hypothetical protein